MNIIQETIPFPSHPTPAADKAKGKNPGFPRAALLFDWNNRPMTDTERSLRDWGHPAPRRSATSL